MLLRQGLILHVELARFPFVLTEKWPERRDVRVLSAPTLFHLRKVPPQALLGPGCGVLNTGLLCCEQVALSPSRKLVSQLSGLFPCEKKGGGASASRSLRHDLVPKKDSLFPNPASYPCQRTSPLMCPGCKTLAGLLILAASFCPQAGVVFSIHSAWLSFQGTGLWVPSHTLQASLTSQC